MYEWFILITTILLILLIKRIKNVNRIQKYATKFPGPKGLPIVGCVYEFGTTKEILPVFLQYQRKYGNIVSVPVGTEPNFLLLSGGKMLEFTMGSIKTINKGADYEFLHKWLGLGLLTSNGEKWQKRRKLITPTYHFNILEQFMDIINENGDILVHKLRKEIGKAETDIYSFITLNTLDVICETAMGISVNAQKNEDSEYINAVRVMAESIVERSLHPLLIYKPFFYLSRTHLKQRKALKILHSTTDAVIKKRRAILQKKSKARTEEKVTKKRLAFLDMLIESSINGSRLSDADIREEVDTFMFEGHDTTASGISFTLYLISIHPEIQDKIIEELREIFHDDENRITTSQDLREMKYLEMVIKESLRLYPPVPIFTRMLDQDINYNGEILPKDLQFLIFPYGAHHDEKIYPDPEAFIPERFSLENADTKRNPFSYMPFSAGPRNCIGQKFAMMEMKHTISKILKNFELLPVENYKPQLVSELILKSSNGIMLKIKERVFK